MEYTPRAMDYTPRAMEYIPRAMEFIWRTHPGLWSTHIQGYGVHTSKAMEDTPRAHDNKAHCFSNFSSFRLLHVGMSTPPQHLGYGFILHPHPIKP